MVNQRNKTNANALRRPFGDDGRSPLLPSVRNHTAVQTAFFHGRGGVEGDALHNSKNVSALRREGRFGEAEQAQADVRSNRSDRSVVERTLVFSGLYRAEIKSSILEHALHANSSC